MLLLSSPLSLSPSCIADPAAVTKKKRKKPKQPAQPAPTRWRAAMMRRRKQRQHAAAAAAAGVTTSSLGGTNPLLALSPTAADLFAQIDSLGARAAATLLPALHDHLPTDMDARAHPGALARLARALLRADQTAGHDQVTRLHRPLSPLPPHPFSLRPTLYPLPIRPHAVGQCTAPCARPSLSRALRVRWRRPLPCRAVAPPLRTSRETS